MSRLPVHKLRTNTKKLDLGDAQVIHLPNWNALSHPERLGVMRQISMMRGRDPRIAKLAVSIFKANRIQPREYAKQAAALLAWVQNPKNVFYVNEPGERLQDPIHTIKVGHGDCDDQSLLLTCLFESVGLPWKFVLSGRDVQGNKVRYIEGDKVPPGSKWSHIYCMVGTPPFQPNEWYFCETTVVGVPLGWDVISGDHSYLPEMAKSKTGKPQIMVPGPANGRYRPSPLPPAAQRSPAYQEAMGGLGDLVDNSSLVGQASNVAQAAAQVIKQDWKAIAATAVIGTIASNLALQYFNGEGLFAGAGHFFTRWGRRLSNVAQNSKLFPKIS